MAINNALYKNMTYDAARDFEPFFDKGMIDAGEFE